MASPKAPQKFPGAELRDRLEASKFPGNLLGVTRAEECAGDLATAAFRLGPARSLQCLECRAATTCAPVLIAQRHGRLSAGGRHGACDECGSAAAASLHGVAGQSFGENLCARQQDG